MAGVFRPNTHRRRPNAVFPHARPRGDDAGAGRQRLLVGWGQQQPTVKVGSVGFDEARIMAEAYAQVLENAGYTVNRDGIGLGDRSVLQPALESGQIDLQPEYIGSSLGSKAYGGSPTGDPAANLTALQAILNGKGGGITALNYTPAQDQNAFVVRKETADQYSADQDERRGRGAGQAQARPRHRLPHEPAVRRGAEGRVRHRHDERDAARRRATRRWRRRSSAKTIDLGELCSTQPDILVNNFVLLQDDKQTQPADNISPLVRNDFLAKTDKAVVREAPQRPVGQDRHADPRRPVQAGQRRQEGHQGRGLDLAQGPGPRQVVASRANSGPRHRRGPFRWAPRHAHDRSAVRDR